MSPGFVARPPGMFSVSGVVTTRLILGEQSDSACESMSKESETYGSLSCAAAKVVATTTAAPPRIIKMNSVIG